MISEATSVGGLSSSRTGEVLIYSISVDLRLAEQKQSEWVAREKAEKRKPQEEQSAVSQVYSIMFNSFVVKTCLLALMYSIVKVACIDLYTLVMYCIYFLFFKKWTGIDSHSKMCVLGAALREIERLVRYGGKG